mgnify:CR=1 FL=1
MMHDLSSQSLIRLDPSLMDLRIHGSKDWIFYLWINGSKFTKICCLTLLTYGSKLNNIGSFINGSKITKIGSCTVGSMDPSSKKVWSFTHGSMDPRMNVQVVDPWIQTKEDLIFHSWIYGPKFTQIGSLTNGSMDPSSIRLDPSLVDLWIQDWIYESKIGFCIKRSKITKVES